jgi:hypothetical protein
MPRPRQRQSQRAAHDLTPKTTQATFTAAADVLTAHGWADGETFRMRPTSVGPDEVLIAPIVGGIDTMPGTSSAAWNDQEHKATWHAAARRLAQDITDAGWTAQGATGDGTYFHRPAGPGPAAVPSAAVLAAAPPGAPVRLLAIAAELSIGSGDLDKAVHDAATEAAAGHLASAVNAQGLATQLAYLYEGCVSEAAFRSMLRDLPG